MEGYEVKVKECSKNLTGKERVAIKDISNAVKLDSVVTPDASIEIIPDFTATLDVHNENAENKDYEIFVIVAKDGTKYITSSRSFITSFKGIEEEMMNEEDEWGIEVYKIESKNFKGRHFLTCSII